MTCDAGADQCATTALRQAQQRKRRIAEVVECAEKDGEIVVAVEFEAPLDVALDQLLRSPRERSRAAKALAVVVLEKADAVIVGSPTVFAQQHRQIAELALKYRVPSLFQDRVTVEVGGLMSYGQKFTASYERSATYVDKILKGAKPGDLPVEQPVTLELVVNLKTAKALGLTIPQSILLRADEVIQ
jgi:putative tryptophan/tyrosine transport system substrate-binding protein